MQVLRSNKFIKERLLLSNVAGLQLAVLPSRHLEANLITLVESLEAIHLNLGEVNEKIVAVLTRDETVALVRIEPLNRTFSHV